MNRQEQRELGALQIAAARAREEGLGTLAETIHASADLMEWLAIRGTDIFKDYPAKVRRRMATEGRAMPDGSFPIADCADAADAIHSVGRAAPGKRSAVEAHIRKRVRALGCTGSIFDNWR